MSTPLRHVCFPSLADAILTLERTVGRFLLAVQEEGVTGSTAGQELDRLGLALFEVQEARARAADVAGARPCLTVIDGEVCDSVTPPIAPQSA